MNQKIRISLAVIFGIFLVVALGWTVWEKKRNLAKSETTEQQKINIVENQKQQKQNEQEKNINILEEAGENNDISINTWKIYKNNEQQYSIKYPSEWVSSFVDGSSFFVKELRKPEEDFPNFGNVLSENQENLKNISGDYFINISFYKKIGVNVDLKEWRKHDGDKYEEVIVKDYPALKFNDKPHKSINNKDMAGSLRYYFVDKNNSGYEITIWYKDSSNGIGDKIVSTLEFQN